MDKNDSQKEFLPEEILMGAIDEWLKEPEIDGTKIIEENLQRLNKANILMANLLRGEKIVDIKFEAPSKDLSYTSSHVYCEGLFIEDLKRKEAFKELVDTVDGFAIGAINSTIVKITYFVDNVWVE